MTESPNTSPQWLKLLLVVNIVGCFSYLIEISWNRRLESSGSIGRNPTSSIIRTLQEVKFFSLLARVFSCFAFLSWSIGSLQLMK